MVCSGVGTGFGIILLVLYFWDDIKKTINQNCNEQNNSTDMSKDPRFYDDDTIESMR